ncbi:MAG: peptidylprolyl isomerase [Desulfopila sp.]|jgi:FKBP-type peptidyl-prolyl cis-trans isomerase 2|nr:peptidylprolyl isomerase [Desulfopila sp.]
MSAVRENSTITITYIGKLDNGEVFKTIDTDSPLTITLGKQELPPTLEKALIGMKEGETVKVRVTPEEGYGARQKLLVQNLDRKSLPGSIEPLPGMILSLKVKKEGEVLQVPATVMEVSENSVIVDYNHPLAGHHLTYHVTIVGVKMS